LAGERERKEKEAWRMGDDEELSRSMEQLEMAKARLENLTKEAELLQMSLNEHMRAVATIRSFINLPEGREVLVPVGAGAFISAKSAGTGWALVSIGAGVTQEKKFDDAISVLEKEAAEIELEERKILQEMRAIEKQANMLNQKVQAMSQGVQEAAPAPPRPKPKKNKDEEE
jgi:prefoldin alpha subunit